MLRSVWMVGLAVLAAGCLDLSPDGKAFATGGGDGAGGGEAAEGGGSANPESSGGGSVSAGGGSVSAGGGSSSVGGGSAGGGSVSVGGGSVSAGGGSVSAGGGSSGGGSTSVGGGSAGGGSSSAGGGTSAAKWTFTTLGIPSGVNTEVHRVSVAGDTWYAVARFSRLLRRVGNGAIELVGTPNSPYGFDVVYAAPGGAVFVGGNRTTGHCLSNCGQLSSFTFVEQGTDVVAAICGRSSSEVYAIANRSNSTGAIYKFNGTAWAEVASNIGVREVQACVMQADGGMLISGRGRIARYANGGLTQETIDIPGLTQNQLDFTTFTGLAIAGGEVLAVGSDERHLRRGADGVWRRTASNPMPAIANLKRAASVGPDIFFGGGRLHGWNGSTFTMVTNVPVPFYANDIAGLGTNQLVLVGTSGQADPMVVVGTR